MNIESNIIKRQRGRPRVLTDEQRIKNKTAYMLNKPWFCEICNNELNYSLAGKSLHLRTLKHQKKICNEP